MIKIFETSIIKGIEQYTIENEPIDAVDLVERAASVFVNEFTRRFASRQHRIYVFAGPGNNGADALAIARMLAEREYNVFAYQMSPSGRLSDECETSKRRFREIAGDRYVEIISPFTPPKLEQHDVVVDGLLGSGLNRPLEGGFAKIVDYINRSDATVVSVDIPSGLFGEDNSSNNATGIIKADLTLTFEFPKLAFLLSENADFVGEWKTLPIELHPDALTETPTHYSLITDDDVASLLYKRNRFAHKGDFGHALLIAGSVGKMGAAVLAAKACLRSGAGLLTTHLPARGETVMHVSLPEAMVSMDRNPDRITDLPDLSKYSAIAVGPGIGVENGAKTIVRRLLSEADGRPLVIDADALNIIAADSELLRLLPEKTILTPHPKEFDRIAGDSSTAYERLQKARSIAAEQKICIALKGAYTAICMPSGKVIFNMSGNPGMATAGSGDALTGILAGLLSQGYRPEEAAVIGVHIHGAAGDLAAGSLSEESLIASDIVDALGKAFKQASDL